MKPDTNVRVFLEFFPLIGGTIDSVVLFLSLFKIEIVFEIKNEKHCLCCKDF